MEGSTGRQRVPDDVFKKRLLVPVPSQKEQEAIAYILDAVDKVIEQAQEATSKARNLEHSLLHDLLENGLFNKFQTGEKQTRLWAMNRVDEVAEVGSGVTLGRTSGFIIHQDRTGPCR
jgi:type I restriction enzyme S subunit